MKKNDLLKCLDDGLRLRIKTWPENFYLQKLNDLYVFSDGKILKDYSFFDVLDWEIYDDSNSFFAARCESERLLKIKHFSLEDDIIDL